MAFETALPLAVIVFIERKDSFHPMLRIEFSEA
ncbi:Uncharacterised protein [Mycobacteroides abscessus subsp. abscessus]|nr:Uncharacterised protein [Mycobacteroides abscessus subsp. abscessus]